MGSTLRDLGCGQRAVLGEPTRYTPEILRLMEMGLVPGREVSFLRAAPLGDPLEVQIGATRLSIRKADAGLFPIEAGERA